MKKTFKCAVLALATLAMGSVMTSCDEVTNLISQLFNPGQTYTYTGTVTSQALTGSSTDAGWRGSYINASESNTSGLNTYQSQQVVLKSTSTTADLTLPAYTDGKVKVSQITISGLTQTLNEAQTETTLGIDPESTMIDGTITVNNVEYTIGYVFFSKAAATTTSLNLEMTLYFYGNDDKDANGNVQDYSKAINFTFQGAAPASE